MKHQLFTNILVVRTDRIGDVVLSLPMISVLRSNFPSAKISMLVRSYTRDIAEASDGLSAVLLYDAVSGPKPFGEMLSEIRSARFDLAVIAFPRFRLALLLFLAGIPMRVGSGYRWYSFLFNKPVYEHRKTGEKHESEYNLGLLKAIGIEVEGTPRPSIEISEAEKARAILLLESLGVSVSHRLVILHPGSGGSARDWPIQRFGDLASLLLKDGLKVIVTGGPGEEKLVGQVVESSGGKAIPLAGKLGLREMAALLRCAALFVSNSTGPLHIAAAVGTPVIAFYPDIPACSPRRWGPLTDRKIVFTPDRNRCPRCKGGECEANVCMDQIEVPSVLSAAKQLLPIHQVSAL